ncbi:helix-turn-helix domain-containing protein [Streptomyces mirabilis]|uniref:helix-turn-helix domain-containing protein n=1 Tax=Streptomyces mirabilis TaxID=68239 RepID=UPI003D9ECFB0
MLSDALRSRIVLESADGQAIAEVAQRLGITTDTVRLWRRRFLERRLNGLCDEPRPGVPREITDADVDVVRVIVKALEETPKDATDRSTRSMAAATGMSQSAVSRIWRRGRWCCVWTRGRRSRRWTGPSRCCR